MNLGVLPERLKRARLKHGDSQEALSCKLFCSAMMVSNYENGLSMMPIDRFILLCKCYKISADYLLGLTDEPNSFNKQR